MERVEGFAEKEEWKRAYDVLGKGIDTSERRVDHKLIAAARRSSGFASRSSAGLRRDPRIEQDFQCRRREGAIAMAVPTAAEPWSGGVAGPKLVLVIPPGTSRRKFRI